MKTKPLTVPGSPGTPAQAYCPTCQNLVYNDRLRALNPYIDERGTKRWMHLLIDCEICGAVTTVEFTG